MGRTDLIPPDYVARKVSIGFNRRGMVVMYMGIVCIGGGVVEAIGRWMPRSFEVTTVTILTEVGWVLLAMALMTVLHEVAHFLAYRMCGAWPRFTKVKVKGFGWCPAVVSGSGLFTRQNIVWACLAPQVLSLLGIGVALAVPVEIGRVLMYAVLANCVGGIGDYQMLIQVIRCPKGSLFGDKGAEMEAYVPQGGKE